MNQLQPWASTLNYHDLCCCLSSCCSLRNAEPAAPANPICNPSDPADLHWNLTDAHRLHSLGDQEVNSSCLFAHRLHLHARIAIVRPQPARQRERRQRPKHRCFLSRHRRRRKGKKNNQQRSTSKSSTNSSAQPSSTELLISAKKSEHTESRVPSLPAPSRSITTSTCRGLHPLEHTLLISHWELAMALRLDVYTGSMLFRFVYSKMFVQSNPSRSFKSNDDEN